MSIEHIIMDSWWGASCDRCGTRYMSRDDKRFPVMSNRPEEICFLLFEDGWKVKTTRLVCPKCSKINNVWSKR